MMFDSARWTGSSGLVWLMLYGLWVIPGTIKAAGPRLESVLESAPESAPESGVAVEWKAKYYNPKPLPDDRVLPLPCGGAMAFRPVPAEASGPLADLRIEVGSDGDEHGYAEHTQPAWVAGPFAGAQAGQREMLVGKYEVSRLQYAAVLAASEGAPCPRPTGRARLPMTGVGYFEALRFAHEYSLWLRAGAASLPPCGGGSRACLPRVDGEPAFVRLPSGVEWEYAARGGSAVSPADFREPRPPMPDGVERYAWFNANADGSIRPVGVLEANPLGLHDMLGNVEEMVLDPFRLHRLEREHGQLGGYVVRGGSIHSGRDELRSSLRREVPLYDDRGAVSTADTGFRVALSVPVIRSRQQFRDLKQAWDRLGTDVSRPAETVPARPQLDDTPFADPILELTALARAAPDPAMKRRLERLRSVMAEQHQKLFEQRDRNARETLRFGGLLCLKLHDEGRNVERKRASHARCEEGFGAGHERCTRLADKLAGQRRTLDDNIRFFADSVVRSAQTFADDLGVLNQQLVALKAEIDARGYGAYAVYPQRFLAQLTAYAGSGTVERERWFEQCVALD